jgi:hypothetical protein
MFTSSLSSDSTLTYCPVFGVHHNPVLRLLRRYRIIVLGDREFHGVALGCWLEEMSVSFVLRLPKSTTVKLNEQAEFERLDELLQYPGFSSFEVQVRVTKQTGFGRFNLATRWKRVYRANQANQVWYLLTNLDTLELALKHYAARFSIEILQPQCPHKSEAIDAEAASALTVFGGTLEHSLRRFKGIRKGQFQ